MVNPKEHWKSKAAELKKERRFEEAVEIFDKLKEITKSEKSEDYWYKKAQYLYEIGEYDQAKDALFKELESNPKNYNSFFLLGQILFELSMYDKSLECLNKASEVHNSQILKNIHKVEQMKNVHKFEEAIVYSDKVKQEHPLGEKYWHLRGMVLFKLKKFENAISCFNSILESNKDNTKILYQLAKAELYAGNTDKSFKILQRICTIEPNNKEKLRLDEDFKIISNDKQFRMIIGPLDI
ncbi:MAG: tetratricopeptide repeat protein [Nitrosopumilus sp.]|nr:tetratricopeptide repeat protein [Nitrosopumilus sp.]MDH3515397.1 tetratricopeptide repeat protein [Nitrosopumilus sp.]MDH3564302.1 tetratricopeptide repeat protein [Nitrosopumilus sp.]MDH5417185.1 tetratricopeptide repeat protein [Nitrosopumilus sp.]MDH5555028.1 tetratricopeptide repeat protein [Nitrosopumilus sp.]